MTTRSIRIPDEVDAKLTALAEAEHISVNSAIVRAVEELIVRRAQEAVMADAGDYVFARRADLFRRLSDA